MVWPLCSNLPQMTEIVRKRFFPCLHWKVVYFWNGGSSKSICPRRGSTWNTTIVDWFPSQNCFGLAHIFTIRWWTWKTSCLKSCLKTCAWQDFIRSNPSISDAILFWHFIYAIVQLHPWELKSPQCPLEPYQTYYYVTLKPLWKCYLGIKFSTNTVMRWVGKLYFGDCLYTIFKGQFQVRVDFLNILKMLNFSGPNGI